MIFKSKGYMLARITSLYIMPRKSGVFTGVGYKAIQDSLLNLNYVSHRVEIVSAEYRTTHLSDQLCKFVYNKVVDTGNIYNHISSIYWWTPFLYNLPLIFHQHIIEGFKLMEANSISKTIPERLANSIASLSSLTVLGEELKYIHGQLRDDPELAIILTDEQIGEIVKAFSRESTLVIVTGKPKAAPKAKVVLSLDEI